MSCGGSAAVAALGDLRSDFRAGEVGERVSSVCRPTAGHLEVQSHDRSELRKQFELKTGVVVQTGAGLRNEEASEGSVLGSCAAEDPIQQQTPSAQAPRVHQRSKS